MVIFTLTKRNIRVDFQKKKKLYLTKKTLIGQNFLKIGSKLIYVEAHR